MALVAETVGNRILAPKRTEESENELVDMNAGKNLVQEILEVETSEDFDNLVTKIQMEHSQNTENYGQLVGNTLLGMVKKSEEERSLSEIRKFCKIIQSSEYRIHESQAEAHMCMKRMLSPSEYATLNTCHGNNVGKNKRNVFCSHEQD